MMGYIATTHHHTTAHPHTPVLSSLEIFHMPEVQSHEDLEMVAVLD